MQRTIEHVIVLMLENRSFDHMLGFLDHPGLVPLDPEEHYNEAGTIGRIPVSATATPAIAASPKHHHRDVMGQLGIHIGEHGAWPDPLNPSPVGYLTSYAAATTPGQGPVVMRSFDPENVPVLATLAREFAVFDRWFCSVPGSTLPNRRFLHAGSSRGATDNSQCKTLSSERTVFEMLDASGHDWAIFHQDATQTYMYRYVLRNLDRVYETASLMDAISAGGPLPTYSFVDPDHGIIGTGNSQHPGDNEGTATSFLGGERLMATLYEALRSQPELFAKTALLITYDEHGGFYDRMAPPTDAAPPDGIAEPRWGFDFTIFGPRVPAVLVHPAMPPGSVIHDVFDHASVPALLRLWFAPNEAPVGNRWQGGVNDVVERLQADIRSDLPDLSSHADPFEVGSRSWLTAADESPGDLLDDTDFDELQRDLATIALLADQYVDLRERGIRATGAATPILDDQPALARAQTVQALRSLHDKAVERRRQNS